MYREKNWSAIVLKHFTQDGKTLDFRQFEEARKNLTQIRNICAVTRLDDEARLKIDYDRAKKTPWLDLNCFMFSANLKHVSFCLRALEVTNVFDFATSFTPHQNQLP